MGSGSQVKKPVIKAGQKITSRYQSGYRALDLPANWTDQITIGIKTFLRPKCLKNGLQSIRRFYPTIRIIVADDSTRKIKRKNRRFIQSLNRVTHLSLPFDIGLSAGRNRIVKMVTTKYILMVDDDTVFNDRSRIDKMFRFLEAFPDYQLIGGISTKSRGYNATFLWTQGKTLYYRKRSYGSIPNEICQAVRTDRTLNYILVRTKDLLTNLWISKLKLCEHNVFFVRAWEKGWRMAFTPEVVFENKKYNSERYKDFRYRRIQKYCQIAEKMTYAMKPASLKQEKRYLHNHPQLSGDLRMKMWMSRRRTKINGTSVRPTLVEYHKELKQINLEFKRKLEETQRLKEKQREIETRKINEKKIKEKKKILKTLEEQKKIQIRDEQKNLKTLKDEQRKIIQIKAKKKNLKYEEKTLKEEKKTKKNIKKHKSTLKKVIISGNSKKTKRNRVTVWKASDQIICKRKLHF